MYKTPKKHSILNETKIYLISVKDFKSKTGYYLDVFFTIKDDTTDLKGSAFFKRFYNESLEYKEQDYLISKEIYKKYKNKEITYSEVLNNKQSLIKLTQPMLSYNKDLKLFSLHEALYKCPIVDAAITQLKDFKNGITYSHFYPESELFNILRTLDMFWD